MNKSIRAIPLVLSFGFIPFIFGCTTSKQSPKTFYDPEYEVKDRGALDVKIISHACSYRFEDALLAAKNNVKFHIRSVVGYKNHGIKFKEVGSYIKKGKICVEMSASSFHP